MSRKRSAFSIIELLIVVTIISILSAIALPNFQEAQTRAKVAAATSNIRNAITALEMYAVDNNDYPRLTPHFPSDPLAIMAVIQLQALAAPIAYVTSPNLSDPFASKAQRVYFNNATGYTTTNPEKSLLYYQFKDLAHRWEMPCISCFGAGLVSMGPDQVDSLGAYRPFSQICIQQMYASSTTPTAAHPVNTTYDPTNGTYSAGDIAGFAGEARRREHL